MVHSPLLTPSTQAHNTHMPTHHYLHQHSQKVSFFFLLENVMGKIPYNQSDHWEGLVSGNWCSLCKQEEEMANHILLQIVLVVDFIQLTLSGLGPSSIR